jgi:hypothetical protein
MSQSRSLAHEQSKLAASKAAGERSEDYLIQWIEEIRYVPDDEALGYDAITTTLLEPSEEIQFVGMCLLERGTEIEIKSTAVVITETQTRGRLQFRKPQHDRLLEIGGVYMIAVCAPHDREPIAVKVIPASLLDELLYGWIEVDGRAPYAQLTWTNLFDVDEIEGGGNR